MNLDKMTFNLQRFAVELKTIDELAQLSDISETVTYLIKAESNAISTPTNIVIGSNDGETIGSVAKLPKTPAASAGTTTASDTGLTVTITVTGSGAEAKTTYSMNVVKVTATYDGESQSTTYATEALTPESSGAFAETVTGVEVASASTDVTLTLASGYSIANGTAAITSGAVTVKTGTGAAVITAPAKAELTLAGTAGGTYTINGIDYKNANTTDKITFASATAATLTGNGLEVTNNATSDEEGTELKKVTYTLGDTTAKKIAGVSFKSTAETGKTTFDGTVKVVAVATEADPEDTDSEATPAEFTVKSTENQNITATLDNGDEAKIGGVVYKSTGAGNTVVVSGATPVVTPTWAAGTLVATVTSSATLGDLAYTGSGDVTYTAANAITLGTGITTANLATGVTDATKITENTFTLAGTTAVKIGGDNGLTFTAGGTATTNSYGTVKLSGLKTTTPAADASIETLTPTANATIKVSGAAFTKDKLTYSNSTNATSTEVTFGTSNIYANGTTITAKETGASAVVLDGASITLAAVGDSVTYTGSKAITVTKAAEALAITLPNTVAQTDAITITATEETGEGASATSGTFTVSNVTIDKFGN